MGGSGDTSLGDGGRAFPPTSVGIAARFAGLETVGYRDLLEDLARRYWKAVYSFIRILRRKSNEDAKDLTQAFFLWLSEREALRRFAPERGGFRTFLKVLLRGFLAHDAEALGRLKRGGGLKQIPFDGEEGNLEESLADPASIDPDRVFDQVWVLAVMRNAALRVGERFRRGGRETMFRVFEAHDLAPGDEAPSYASIAARLGLKESQVRDHLFAVRGEVRAEIRAELERLTPDDEQFQEEWRALFGS